MRRRLLIIYKDPEFDERDEVILGQCEPFTSGWKLILIPPDGPRETLLTGTYTDLRKIQESCAPIDEIDSVRQRVRDMRTLITSAVTETVALKRNGSSLHESTRVLPLGAAAIPEQLGEGLLLIKDEEGALIAVLADPARADDVAALDPNLRLLLEYRPRAIVLDLSRIPEPKTLLADELVSFRDECRKVHVFFGVCITTEAAREMLGNSGRALDVFADSAAALAGIPGK
jgi:hypothetical protein